MRFEVSARLVSHTAIREDIMITIYDWFGYEMSIEDRYRLIKEAGFDGVLLWWSEYLERRDYKLGPQLAREAGLYVENIHAPFQVQDDLWSDNLNGKATVDCYLECIQDCSQLEIPTVVIHLPNDDKPHNKLGLDRIKRIAGSAEDLGINIAFENIKCFKNLSYILDNVDSKHVGLCYDCCHHYHFIPDQDILSKYGDRMMALHLHDYNSELMHLLPFDGVIDWDGAIRGIKELGYEGSIAIEAMNWDYKEMSVQEFLARAYESAIKVEKLKYKDIILG